MRVRRLKKDPAALEITAFLNLIVVLVPFLLSTAVFTRLSVLDMSLPAQSAGVEQLKVNNLQLEVVIRPDAIIDAYWGATDNAKSSVTIHSIGPGPSKTKNSSDAATDMPK